MGLNTLYKGFAVKEQGYSHKAKGVPCQDAAGFNLGDDYAIAVVSDGHGGEKYFKSRDGALTAVFVARECLLEFLEDHRQKLMDTNRWREYLNNLAGHIINKWRDEIEKHFLEWPLNLQEKDICAKYGILDPIEFQANFYGATLLYACLTPSYSFASQIGDGACVFHYAEKQPEIPGELIDPRLGFGVTTSLCDSDAIANFRHFFLESSDNQTKGIFLFTDGVVDSYERGSFLKFNQFLFNKMAENADSTKNQLQEWLPRLSEEGSGDDVSMAGIYIDDGSEKEEL